MSCAHVSVSAPLYARLAAARASRGISIAAEIDWADRLVCVDGAWRLASERKAVWP